MTDEGCGVPPYTAALSWKDGGAGGCVNTRTPARTSLPRKEALTHVVTAPLPSVKPRRRVNSHHPQRGCLMAKVTKRLRFEILRRDQFRCRYCGKTAGEIELRVDHVIPEALGGSSEPSNLATACEPCNTGKSSVHPDAPIVDDVARDALRWARAMQIAATGERAERHEQEEHHDAFAQEWSSWAGERLPEDWESSIDAFIRAGLDDDDICYAVNQTMCRKTIRYGMRLKYFCGVCWMMLKNRRERAAQLVHLVPDSEVG